jgi:hypothetical protein
MRKTILFVTMLLLPAAMAWAAGKKTATIELPWAKSVKLALADAKKGKKPIAVCFIQRKCRLSMHMVKALHEDGRIYRLKERMVWLCVDPTRKEEYKWFLGRCGDAVEGTPTFFFLNHKGQYAAPALAGIEPASGANPDALIRSMREVLGRLKGKMPEADKKKVESLGTEARGCQKSDPAKALGLFRELIRTGDGWRAVEQKVSDARAAVETLVQEGMKKVRAVLTKKASSEDMEKALGSIAESYPDTDAAAWARREMERIRKARKR